MAKRKAKTATSPSSLALRASRFPHRRYQCPAALARLYEKGSTVQLDPLLHADQAQTGERRSVGRHGQVIEPDAVVLDRRGAVANSVSRNRRIDLTRPRVDAAL